MSKYYPNNNYFLYNPKITKSKLFSYESHTKNIVEKNATFYLVDDDIIQDPYVQQKILSDIAIIKDLSIQSMIADYSISRMINQIDASFGNVHPRLFEVLSNFQRSKLDITKTIAQYIIMIQDNFKNIKMDYLKQKKKRY